MAAEPVHPDIIGIALDRAQGFPFEHFIRDFYPAVAGVTFAPLGGVKDGGADARDVGLYADNRRTDAFYQSSVEQDVEAKIRKTVARLREFGRTPKSLTYFTNRTVKYTDRVERNLTDDLDVTIAIKDANYIAAHVNTDDRTRLAFDVHLRQYTEYLKSIGASRLIESSPHVRSPAVYVFLANEVARRSGNEALVDAVTDALALWALEGTNPDTGILRTEAKVLDKIVQELPSVRTLVAPRLRQRLRAMAGKAYDGGRAVRWHRKDDAYCLPFETRRRIEDENVEDEALRLRVLHSLDGRLREVPPTGLGDIGIRQAAEAALRALQIAFEREGLEFAAFLQDGGTGQYPTIFDALTFALNEIGHHGQRRLALQEGAFAILRGVLYNSQPDERDYLHRLSRTYALLFTLSTEPRLIEFFQDMTGDFRLFVGADQIVRALSEHYLEPADQMTRNTLLMAHRQGAKIILTGPALEEIVNHLRGADLEYKNHIDSLEHRLSFEIAREAPQIMLRAYLYARLSDTLGSRIPRNWEGFVQQFVSYGTLHKPQAFEDMRGYLQHSFGFEFESTENLQRLVEAEEVNALSEQLSPAKKDPRLAYNDALLALAVYGRRHRRGETSRVTEFGWGTWWLTGETSILKLTKDIVARHGARYIMRPEFLLNYLTLAPSAQQARRDFAEIFPSMLGIQLSKRMTPAAFADFMDRVREAEQMDDARRMVEMGKLSNQLKSDFGRQYARASGRTPAAADLAAARVAGELAEGEDGVGVNAATPPPSSALSEPDRSVWPTDGDSYRA